MRLSSTLFVLLCLPLSAAAQDAWKKEAIKYVQDRQTSTGGFLSMAPRPEIRLAPTLKATSAALRALHYLEGKIPNKEAAAKFVLSCYDEASGGFSDFPRGTPDVFTTAVGIMAVKEVDLPLDKFKTPVTRYLSKNARNLEEIRIAAAGLERLAAMSEMGDVWLTALEMARNPDGTWGKGSGQARDTGSYAVTWMRLGSKLKAPDLVLKTLRAGQRKDGGFGKEDSATSDLETTYRIMRCFMMLKERPADVDALRGFVLKCRNADGGFGAQPGENSTVGATYFAAIVDHWLK